MSIMHSDSSLLILHTLGNLFTSIEISFLYSCLLTEFCYPLSLTRASFVIMGLELSTGSW